MIDRRVKIRIFETISPGQVKFGFVLNRGAMILKS